MMLGSTEKFRSLYELRFEPDGDAFIYRARPRSLPVRVTREERDAFVAQFVRQARLLTYGLTAMTLAAITLFVMVAPPSPEMQANDLWFWGIIVALVAAFLVAVHYFWHTPSRALARRTPHGPARSRAEARQYALSNLSWGDLMTAVAMALILIALQSIKHDLTQGWHRLWLLVAAGIVAGAAVQAFRKWRYDRES